MAGGKTDSHAALGSRAKERVPSRNQCKAGVFDQVIGKLRGRHTQTADIHIQKIRGLRLMAADHRHAVDSLHRVIPVLYQMADKFIYPVVTLL